MTDGRTLFWRDDILIDTQYSNLAPSGYTAAIVENIFGLTPQAVSTACRQAGEPYRSAESQTCASRRAP